MRDYYIAILVGSIARRSGTEPMGGTNIARWYATSSEEFWERIDIILLDMAYLFEVKRYGMASYCMREGKTVIVTPIFILLAETR